MHRVIKLTFSLITGIVRDNELIVIFKKNCLKGFNLVKYTVIINMHEDK